MLALGDSHTKMFSGLVDNIISVPGATALGLAHRHSKTNARNIFIDALRTSHEIQIFCLGEVDCNALIWRRSQHLKSFVNKSIRHYLTFVKEHSSFPTICSVPLPAVESYQHPPYSTRKVKNRGNIRADKVQRTLVVKMFNHRLEKFSNHYNYYFINLTKYTANAHGTLNMYYAKSAADSHLNHLRLQSILKEEIDKAKGFYNNLQS